jgi:hypothetical protein
MKNLEIKEEAKTLGALNAMEAIDAVNIGAGIALAKEKASIEQWVQYAQSNLTAFKNSNASHKKATLAGIIEWANAVDCPGYIMGSYSDLAQKGLAIPKAVNDDQFIRGLMPRIGKYGYEFVPLCNMI